MSLDGRYRFYIDEDIEDPDFLVVQGKGVRDVLNCKVARQNTVFLSTEPQSVLKYPKQYLSQFGQICTCQDNTKVENWQRLHLMPPVLPWFIGYEEDENDVAKCNIDYDQFESIPTPEKTKLISVISSNKAFTQGHIDRLRFVNRLKSHFGDAIDVFGNGQNRFADKWDVVAPYKYHIVIENSSQDYYWTEKLGDCFLAETFPLYYGCTNLGEYFPESSFEPINIRKPDEAIAVIEKQISGDRYGNSKDVLAGCKQRMLDEYNLFETIAHVCDQLDANLPKEDVTIMPCRSSSSLQNLWNYTIGRNFYKIKAKLYV